MPTEIRSKSHIGAHADMFASRVHEDVVRKWRAHQQRVEQAVVEIAELKTSRDFTDAGRVKVIAAARAKALADLQPLRDRVETVRRLVAEAEAATLAWRQTPNRDRLQYIQRRLEGKDNLQVFEKYCAAAASGDEEFCRAVEEAPASFPLLSGEHLTQARAERAKHSPAAESVKELHAELQMHAAMLSAAEEDLRER